MTNFCPANLKNNVDESSDLSFKCDGLNAQVNNLTIKRAINHNNQWILSYISDINYSQYSNDAQSLKSLDALAKLNAQNNPQTT